MLQVTLIQRGFMNHGGDGGDSKDCVFVADWLKTKGLHKLCSVLNVFKVIPQK